MEHVMTLQDCVRVKTDGLEWIVKLIVGVNVQVIANVPVQIYVIMVLVGPVRNVPPH